MNDSGKAVFLSYASQDAEAARRLCATLRTEGVEVWLDADGGLEHGDEWDAKIRRQIKECVLFIPLISANTQARHEGYFRIEWELAAQRALGIASGVAFILPVVIDDTREPEALVPDKFRSVQWVRLPKGEMTPEIKARFLKLWSHRMGVLRNESGTPVVAATTPSPIRSANRTWAYTAAAFALLGVGIWFWISQSGPTQNPEPKTLNGTAANPPAGPVCEARRLARQAQAIIGIGEEVDLAAAELLTERALKLDDTDAEVWAAASAVDSGYLNLGTPAGNAHVRNAQERALRALSLDGKLYEARQAWAHYLIKDWTRGSRIPAVTEAEPILQQLRRERPRDVRTLLLLGEALLVLRRVDEANEVHTSLDAVQGSAGSGGWHYFQNGYYREADAALDRAIASKPLVAEIGLKIYFAFRLYGDLDMASAALARVPAEQRRTPQAVVNAISVYTWRREPQQLLTLLQPMAGEWILWGIDGPADAIIGDALDQLGRRQAAELSWQQALKQIETRLIAKPTDRSLVAWKLYLQDALGDAAGFAQTKRLFAELAGPGNNNLFNYDLRSRTMTGEEILAGLEQAVNAGARNPRVTPYALRLNPTFDKVRDTPRFQALLARSE